VRFGPHAFATLLGHSVAQVVDQCLFLVEGKVVSRFQDFSE
jgi:hypothetical protein